MAGTVETVSSICYNASELHNFSGWTPSSGRGKGADGIAMNASWRIQAMEGLNEWARPGAEAVLTGEGGRRTRIPARCQTFALQLMSMTTTSLGAAPRDWAGTTEQVETLLQRIQQSLPLLADLLRSDLLLYVEGDQQGSAVVCGEAKPSTVPSVYPDSLLGRKVTRSEQPTLFDVFSRGRAMQRPGSSLVRGAPTVVVVYPATFGNRVVAALAVETGLIEKERQRKKSVVYRRALAQLRGIVLRGDLEAGGNISAMGEHDGPMVISSTGEILYISSIAENLYRKLGYVESLLHHKVTELRSDETVFFKALETGACVEQFVQEGQLSLVKKAIPLTTAGSRSWWARLIPAEAEIDGVVVVIHDITEERQKEQELKIKSAMIQEIHHRVKNNLQTIAALLRLQERRTGSPDVRSILQETINRILSIAVVHEFLSCDESSIVNIKELCQRIVTEVTRGILGPDKHIKFVLAGADVFLPAQQATSCALIINELLQNAVEHGYVGRPEGTILINLFDDGSNLTVEIVDDGHGLAPTFSISQSTSLGLQIVQTLVREDLRGTFSLQDGNGVTAVVVFPKVQRPGARVAAAASTPIGGSTLREAVGL